MIYTLKPLSINVPFICSASLRALKEATCTKNFPLSVEEAVFAASVLLIAAGCCWALEVFVRAEVAALVALTDVVFSVGVEAEAAAVDAETAAFAGAAAFAAG